MPKTVYLQPKHLVRHSRHHTAYTAEAPGPPVPGGPQPKLYKLEFINGVARDVPEDIYQRFKDAGIADTKKPSFPDDDEEL